MTALDPALQQVIELVRKSGNLMISTESVAQELGLGVPEARRLLNELWEAQVIGRKKKDGVEKWHSIQREVEVKPEVAPQTKGFNVPYHNFSWTTSEIQISDLLLLKSKRELDLKPFFQREVVWKHHAKAYLVDTIMQGLPVPEIFVHRNNRKLEVLDGQQRLTAIFEFIDDKCEPLGIGPFSSLPPDAKKHFMEYHLSVREVSSLSDTMVRELFRRLNTNVIPLSAQELRHARFTGRFIRMVEELARDPYWLSNNIVTQDENQRMRTAEFVSELVVAMKEGIQNGRYHLTDFYEAYEQEFVEKVTEAWKSTFVLLFSTYRSLMGDIWNSSWRKKEDFYALFLALYRLGAAKFVLPERRYQEVRSLLFNFREKVTLERNEPGTDPNVKLYLSTVEGGIGAREKRELRINILYNMIMPFCEVRKRRDS